MKRHLLILSVLALLAIIGMGTITLILPRFETRFELIEEPFYTEMILIRDTNGSLSTFDINELEMFDDGEFNISLPTWTTKRLVELNESVNGVLVRSIIHWELPGREHKNFTILTFGADLEIETPNTTLKSGLPKYRFYASAGAGSAVTWTEEITLNRTLIEKYNISSAYVEFESMFRMNCNGSYAVNYGVGIEISLTYRRPLPYTSSPYIISFLALGVFSVGMLLLELRQINDEYFTCATNMEN